MKRAPFSGGEGTQEISGGLSRLLVLAGRVLLMLTALLLTVMPLTESLWTWDHFLRGGQDVEFGLLALAMLLCLILVLCHHRRRGLNLLLDWWHLLSALFRSSDRRGHRQASAVPAVVSTRTGGSRPFAAGFILPLLI